MKLKARDEQTTSADVNWLRPRYCLTLKYVVHQPLSSLFQYYFYYFVYTIHIVSTRLWRDQRNYIDTLLSWLTFHFLVVLLVVRHEPQRTRCCFECDDLSNATTARCQGEPPREFIIIKVIAHGLLLLRHEVKDSIEANIVNGLLIRFARAFSPKDLFLMNSGDSGLLRTWAPLQWPRIPGWIPADSALFQGYKQGDDVWWIYSGQAHKDGID